MRLLLVVAAVAISFVAAPAEAARPHAAKPRVAPKGQCAAKAAGQRPARARRRAERGRPCTRLVSESRTSLIGAPGSFAAPAPFAVVPAAAAPDAPAAPAPDAPAGPALPPVYSDPLALQVRAYEFRLQLSKAAVGAGNVKVEFNLSGAEDPHNLWLVREDGSGSAFEFDEQPSGAVVSRTVPLTAGRWTLLCSLSGHEAAGMRAVLTVG